LVILAKFLKSPENALLYFVFIGELSFGLRVLLVVVAVGFEFVDCLIACILEQQLLHNFLPPFLHKLEADHMGFCATGTESL
jgi:hypothetical protein